MICQGCTERHPFLSAYRGLAVTVLQAATAPGTPVLTDSADPGETPQVAEVLHSLDLCACGHGIANMIHDTIRSTMGIGVHWRLLN
jgi:hypothetical protein